MSTYICIHMDMTFPLVSGGKLWPFPGGANFNGWGFNRGEIFQGDLWGGINFQKRVFRKVILRGRFSRAKFSGRSFWAKKYCVYITCCTARDYSNLHIIFRQNILSTCSSTWLCEFFRSLFYQFWRMPVCDFMLRHVVLLRKFKNTLTG